MFSGQQWTDVDRQSLLNSRMVGAEGHAMALIQCGSGAGRYPDVITRLTVCPAETVWTSQLAGRTHNPPVVGSSPTRPT